MFHTNCSDDQQPAFTASLDRGAEGSSNVALIRAVTLPFASHLAQSLCLQCVLTRAGLRDTLQVHLRHLNTIKFLSLISASVYQVGSTLDSGITINQWLRLLGYH